MPEISFQSGRVNIPDSFVEKLRDVLSEMKNRSNVRLHFIGHSDSDKLSPALRAKYINNIGIVLSYFILFKLLPIYQPKEMLHLQLI